jgi:NhaA family Na+:H+ antiporter
MTSQVAEERPAARLARPLREFLDTEVAGGAVLLGAVLIAIIWANSPWRASYEAVWSTELWIGVGGFLLQNDLRHWVNDGLMAIFFFVVGLEIKRELVEGDLGSARSAMLPAMAALGGMVVPALIFLALNTGEAARGWGIPMATDIAFALGALALLGSKLPHALRVLLLSLAIVDDVGAVVVIAVFYSGGISWTWLGAAVGLLGLILVIRRLRIWWVPLYVIVGAGVWLATLQSGVHPTIAGVALGLLTPPRPLNRKELEHSPLLQRAEGSKRDAIPAEEAQLHRLRITVAVPVTDRLEHILHPWTSYLILPVFALSNAGVPLSFEDLSAAASSPVSLGIVAGLVAGKMLGVSGFAWLSVRLGARLPGELRWRHVMGVAALAGIGFTMSLFISGLAFQDPDMESEAKMGILTGSLLAALIAVPFLRSKPSS